MKNKKKLIRYLLIALVALVILVIVAKKNGWVGKSTEIKVSTELVSKKDIIETVSANGKIQPEIEVKISPDVSGEIVDLYVKEGDQVKKGDLLAKINPDFYLSNLDKMTAAVNTSKATLANSKASLATVQSQFVNAKATYERNKKLYESGAISDSEWDAAQSAYKVAKSAVDGANESVKAAEFNVISAQASLKEANNSLTKTSVYAPVSGTISKLSVEKGERVVGTSQFSGTEMMRIANLKEMEVNVSVNENDIVRVSIGDTAEIEVDAYLNRKFKGLVTEISNSANNATTTTSIDQVTNFDVKVRILRSSYTDLLTLSDTNLSPFRPGMSATVDIQTEIVKNAFAIPIQAVTTREDTTELTDQTKPKKKENKDSESDEEEVVSKKDLLKETTKSVEFVFVYSNGIVTKQVVKTGIQDNTYIQILEGLTDKQEIVTAPFKAISKQLKDGDKVTKVDKKDIFSETDK
ncbi:MAG TPA: efflux RND transporter periplasmic adaptor subunit [Bacteroidales bacterium]|nr:efflux RND transporter periplasmic adaptor subunit [Bacteroidales bacterium]